MKVPVRRDALCLCRGRTGRVDIETAPLNRDAHARPDSGFGLPVVLLLCVMMCSLAAQEIPVQLSPEAKANLRAAAAGYPQLPAPDSKNWRTTAALAVSPLRTQEIALVTVTIVFSNATVMVHDTNGVMQPYLSAKQPLVISVVTNFYDAWRGKEVIR